MDGFEVKASRIDGRGLFSRRKFAARRKLGELTGELVRLREARRRAKETKRIAIVEFEDGWALDASQGNDFRFVNHSCSPNTYLRRFGHKVEFYALREIAPGEELTCNYGETQHEGTLPCRCGSEQCRQRL